jgi:hypothetical protein
MPDRHPSVPRPPAIVFLRDLVDRALMASPPLDLGVPLARIQGALGTDRAGFRGVATGIARARKVAATLPEAEACAWGKRFDAMADVLRRAEGEASAHEEAHRRFSALFRAGEVAELPSIAALMEQVLAERIGAAA